MISPKSQIFVGPGGLNSPPTTTEPPQEGGGGWGEPVQLFLGVQMLVWCKSCPRVDLARS